MVAGQGGWWCCCGEDCTLFDDDFNRADSTDLGSSNWTEVTGDSEIISGELSMPASALVIHPTGTGDTYPWMRAQAECIDQQPGKIYQVIVNYTDTPTTSWYAAELECSVESLGYGVYKAYLRAVSSIDGVLDEVEVSYTPGDTANLMACRTREGLYASSDESIVAWDCVADNGGRKVGLRNDSASLDIEFDNFLSLRGEGLNGLGPDPNQISRCFLCECECDGHCLPDTLTLEFSATGFCSCLDGESITLTVQRTQDLIWWYGEKLIDDYLCTGSDTAKFWLLCEQGSGWGGVDTVDFTLWNNQIPPADEWIGGTGPEADAIVYAKPAEVECDSLDIEFGPFTNTISAPCPPAGCDCTYYITVTE